MRKFSDVVAAVDDSVTDDAVVVTGEIFAALLPPLSAEMGRCDDPAGISRTSAFGMTSETTPVSAVLFVVSFECKCPGKINLLMQSSFVYKLSVR